MAVLYALMKHYPIEPEKEVTNNDVSSNSSPSDPPSPPKTRSRGSSISSSASLSDIPIKKKPIPEEIPFLEPIRIHSKSISKGIEISPLEPTEERRESTNKFIFPAVEVMKSEINEEDKKETKRNSTSSNEDISIDGNKNRCSNCYQLIGGSFIEALGKYFHSVTSILFLSPFFFFFKKISTSKNFQLKDCFVCQQCKTESLVGEFFSRNGLYVCKNCMNPCGVCGLPVTGQFYSGIDGKVYHHQCIPKDKCDRCGENILPTVKKISAFGKHWHEECFLCHGKIINIYIFL